MPLFEYACPDCLTVAERIRKTEERDDPATCLKCGGQMPRVFSAAHIEPDGVYSYAPNEGSEEKFVRWNEKIAKQKEAELEARG